MMPDLMKSSFQQVMHDHLVQSHYEVLCKYTRPRPLLLGPCCLVLAACCLLLAAFFCCHLLLAKTGRGNFSACANLQELALTLSLPVFPLPDPATFRWLQPAASCTQACTVLCQCIDRARVYSWALGCAIVYGGTAASKGKRRGADCSAARRLNTTSALQRRPLPSKTWYYYCSSTQCGIACAAARQHGMHFSLQASS
jgi:hypothetical protein